MSSFNSGLCVRSSTSYNTEQENQNRHGYFPTTHYPLRPQLFQQSQLLYCSQLFQQPHLPSRQKPFQRSFQRPPLCKNGPTCEFINKASGCRFYHPSDHFDDNGQQLMPPRQQSFQQPIPHLPPRQQPFQRSFQRPPLCKNGPTCEFINKASGCRFYHPSDHFNDNGVQKSFSSMYIIGKCLGEGTYGKVHIAICVKTGKQFAVKKTSPKDDSKTEFKLQQTVHDSSGHLSINVCKPFALFEEPLNSYVLLEFIFGGSLKHHIKKKLPEETVKRYMWQIAHGLKACHSNGIAHRDLKSDNILFDQNADRCKIADFGSAFQVSHEKLAIGWVTTLMNCPPEVLLANPWGSEEYDPIKLDIWSLGIIMLELLSGKYPYAWPISDKELARRIRAEAYDLPVGVSVQALDLCRKMLQRNPSDRPTVSEILYHPWFCVDDITIFN